MTKITFIVLAKVRKVIGVVKLKISWEEVNIGISSKHLISKKILTAEW